MPLYVKYRPVLDDEIVYTGPYSKDDIHYHYRDLSGWIPTLVTDVEIVEIFDELIADN